LGGHWFVDGDDLTGALQRGRLHISSCPSWFKWSCEAGVHLMKPGWSKPHTHSHPTNLALFGHKITLYRFNQGLILLQGLKSEQGTEPPGPLTLTTGCPTPSIILSSNKMEIFWYRLSRVVLENGH